jgi:hypothetical protein
MGLSPCITWTSTDVWLSEAGRKDLALSRRDRRITRDHLRKYATQSFDTQRQRRNVEQQNVVFSPPSTPAWTRSTERHNFGPG